jgi:hypothetical protein
MKGDAAFQRPFKAGSSGGAGVQLQTDKPTQQGRRPHEVSKGLTTEPILAALVVPDLQGMQLEAPADRALKPAAQSGLLPGCACERGVRGRTDGGTCSGLAGLLIARGHLPRCKSPFPPPHTHAVRPHMHSHGTDRRSPAAL